MCSVRPWSLLVSFLVGIELSGQWQLMPTPTSAQLYSVHGTPGNILAGGTGFLLRSADNGATWDSLPIFFQPGQVLTTLQVFDIHDRGSGVHFICGYDLSSGANNRIWRSNNAGTSWSLVYSGPGGLLPTLYALDFDAGNIGLAAGTPGRVVRTANGGGSWQDALNTNNAFRDVAFDPLQAGRAVAVGEGEIVRATVNAQNWNATSAPNAAYRGVQFIGPNTALAVGMGGTVVRSTNGGSNWSPLTTYLPGPLNLFDLHFINDQEGYVLANDRILRTTNGGVHWEWFPLEGPMNALHFVSPTEGYAVGQGGRVYRMVPGGAYHPVAVFNGPVSACPGVPVSFTNLSAAGLSLQWLVDGVPAGTGGTLDWTFTEPVQQPTVALVVSNGAFTDTLEQVVSVGQTPVTPIEAVAVSTVLCAGQSTQVVVSNSIVGGTYRLRRGTTVLGASQAGNGGTLTFSTGPITLAFDTLNVQVTRNLVGCGVITAQLEIPLQLDVPLVDLAVGTSTPTVCLGQQAEVVVQGSEAGLSYQLRSGGAPVGSAQIGTGGPLLFSTGPNTSNAIYSVRVTTALGCEDDLAQMLPITVQVPEANWGPTSLNPVLGTSVDMMNASVAFGGSFQWEFGPGATPATSTEEAPAGVVFNTPGVRTVQLLVTTPLGCTAATEQVLHVIEQPIDQDCGVTQVAHPVGVTNSTAVAVTADGGAVAFIGVDVGLELIAFSGAGDTVYQYLSGLSNSPPYNALIRYDRYGVPQWMVQLDGSSASAADVIEAPDGDIFLACIHGGDSLWTEGSDGARSAIATPPLFQNFRVVLLRIDPLGRVQWSRVINAFAVGGSMAYDPLELFLDDQGGLRLNMERSLTRLDPSNGDVLWQVVGEPFTNFVSTAVSGDGSTSALDVFAMEVHRYDANGVHLGSIEGYPTIPDVQRLEGGALLELEGGDLLVHGRIRGSVVLEPGIPLEGPYVLDSCRYFFARMDPEGVFQWVASYDIVGRPNLLGMAVANGRAYLNIYFGAAPDSLRLPGQSPMAIDPNEHWMISVGLNGQDMHAAPLTNDQAVIGNWAPFAGNFDMDPATGHMACWVGFEGGVIAGTDTAENYMGFVFSPIPQRRQRAVIYGDPYCLLQGLPGGADIPQAFFSTPQGACAGEAVEFTDASLFGPTAWNWSFPGGSPASSTEPSVNVTYAAPGTYAVTLVVSNANGNGLPYTSEFLVDICTTVPTAGGLVPWRAYPNPASTTVWIEGPGDTPVAARLLDMSGRLLWQGTARPGDALDVSDRPAGAMVLELDADEGLQRIRLAVVR